MVGTGSAAQQHSAQDAQQQKSHRKQGKEFHTSAQIQLRGDVLVQVGHGKVHGYFRGEAVPYVGKGELLIHTKAFLQKNENRRHCWRR